MVEVFLNHEINITEHVGSISWSGGRLNAARQLQLGMVNGVKDHYTDDLYIKNGSILTLVKSGETLFEGFVFFNERSASNGTVFVTAYDLMIYLLKSREVYNFKDTTPENIVSLICSQFQMPLGDVVYTGVEVEFIANKKSLYDIIMQAYTRAAKATGAKYMLKVVDNKISVVEIGAYNSTFLLSDESNIINSGYSESVENMVNRVKIYDYNSKYVGVVENDDWIKDYGVLQSIYLANNDENGQIEAKAMIEGVSQDISVEATGSVECITGNGVLVKDTSTNLTGLFYITNDTHTWQNGQHIMRLILSFDRLMDERG